MINTDQEYIYGKNPVLELLEQSPDQISKLFIRNSLSGNAKHELVRLSKQHKIPVSVVPGSKLYDLVGQVQDQGIVAQVSSISYTDYHTWIQTLDLNTSPLVFVLDEIEDPHNFGAILRSAAAFGVSGVIIPKHHQAQLSSAAIKTSAGTAGRIPIIRVVNTNQTLDDLKEHSFWVAGLDMHADKSIWQEDFKTPVAIVLGNEGKGIRPSTLSHCDYKLTIPMSGLVESLNVSVSSGIVGAAYHAVIQKMLG